MNQGIGTLILTWLTFILSERELKLSKGCYLIYNVWLPLTDCSDDWDADILWKTRKLNAIVFYCEPNYIFMRTNESSIIVNIFS